MIEAVTNTDIDKLADIVDGTPRAKQRAIAVLMDIINRLARPRAYISEPTPTSDASNGTMWTTGYDMLTAILMWEEHTSVIEPETIRDLSLFSTALDNLTDATDPLLLTLLSGHNIDVVYIPADGASARRHAMMRNEAIAQGISVVHYRPRVARACRATPPITS